MKVVALAGGTGSAKILRGLKRLNHDLTVISNVGDNIWMHGLYICPDLDTAMYTLAGAEHRVQGWGLAGDTFKTLTQLEALGEPAWFKLGDRDLATHILRTRMLRDGLSLTATTERLRRAFGVKQVLIPATDDPVETWVRTPRGTMHLQEFWVMKRGRPRVLAVSYRGSSKAQLTAEVMDSILRADRIVICPGNPVTSIGPMLSLPGFVKLLSGADARVTALSPMIGNVPFSGPAGKLLKAAGLPHDSAGVARLYAPFLDSILIDRSDRGMRAAVERIGPECRLTDALLDGAYDERRLAEELISI
ncbi:MAG: 2-phospho-L-lactate transferase [Thaumarchaeota archaeon]|nr:2-phospho-L-lactate transferase [Nitrososphaerota archaeon]